MRLTIALLALLPLLTAACGGSADPAELSNAGYKALGAGDFSAAKADFDTALDHIGENASHPDYLRAKMGAIEARTKDDPQEAVSMFLALAKKLPDQVGAADFNRIGGLLGSAGNFDQAVELATAGMDAFPNSEHLQSLVNNLGDQAQSSGSSDALKALQGLGYTGG